MSAPVVQEKLSSSLQCRACKKETRREIRCWQCGKCPVCTDMGFLWDGESVIPCYNCNPDGMGHMD